MKYTKESALKEIKRRANEIRQKRDRRITSILTATASITLITLFAVIRVFSGAEVSETQNAYGSFILSVDTCGYVLTAILGFILGILVTVITKRLKKANKKRFN
jgi:hypothetical protein